MSFRIIKRTKSAVVNNRTTASGSIGDMDNRTRHYWIYSPGNGSKMWDKFYNDGVMAIAREYLGNLTQYSSREEMKEQMILHGSDAGATSYKYASLETWQFANELQVGDIVFVKRGKHTVLGRGVVTSEYYYDEEYSDQYRNLRKVNWTHHGEWVHPGEAITKALTDITPYTNYVNAMNSLFEDVSLEDEICANYNMLSSYSKADFLDEVYISSAEYDILSSLLINKKNIILQGAPGVGKTFAARRLAYSLMGVKDPNRVMMVQFHQSYSYEDFVMGFRPAISGFELKKGAFYSFCKKAELDNKNDYFFIIDEINRCNLSKIFGELFMLIENDKRGIPLQLLYSEELFSVPKNVYIIGMMNTADRSIAMLDYALRRRFAFFELSPAFESKGFRRYRQKKNNKKFDSLISAIEKLNIAIENDEALGRGFRIGHSYFCTENAIDDMWLNSVVTCEIIPLLNEYWFDDTSKVCEWTQILREAIK